MQILLVLFLLSPLASAQEPPDIPSNSARPIPDGFFPDNPPEGYIPNWLATKIGVPHYYEKDTAGETKYVDPVFFIGKNPTNKHECEVIVFLAPEYALLLVGDKIRFKDMYRDWGHFTSEDNNFFYLFFHLTPDPKGNSIRLMGPFHQDKLEFGFTMKEGYLQHSGNVLVTFEGINIKSANIHNADLKRDFVCEVLPKSKETDKIAANYHASARPKSDEKN